MKNTKLIGNEYEYLNNGKTFTYQNCESICNSNQLCKGWDYNLDTYACNLYTDVNGIESTYPSNYVAGLKTLSGNNREITTKNNTRCVADTSRFYKSNGIGDCANICLNDDSCYSYTVDNSQPDSCIIMGKNPVCTEKTGYTSGYVPSTSSTVTCQTAPSQSIMPPQLHLPSYPISQAPMYSSSLPSLPIQYQQSVPFGHLSPALPQQYPQSIPFSHLPPTLPQQSLPIAPQQQATFLADIMKAKSAFANARKTNVAHF